MKEKKPIDEVKVIASIVRQLENLQPDAQERVLRYLKQRFFPEMK